MLPVPVLPIAHGLNLELMLPQLQPDFVLAGLCGALPIVRRLQTGRAIALSEMVELYRCKHPHERDAIDRFLHGIDIW